MEKLLAELDRRYQPRTAAPITWGKVTSTSPVEVTFAGENSGTQVALRDAGYTVALNDKVWLVRVGTQWLIAGKVVSA